ncbi:MAG TPA: substrate-binding domain-containing protein [Puia sp.]|jgi:phosphate transport system substrate-binding protein|nr:substrate-binding domain-containing protein [Puia sp.]
MTGKCFLTGFLVCLALGGCKSGPKINQETPTSGTINISVDESFKPVIDSQIKVFESSWPDAHIIVHYRSEAQCLRDLTTDTTRMVLVTRGLTEEEINFYKDSFHFKPNFAVLAWDGIAVIVNPSAKDSVFEIKDLQDMLSGKDTRHQPVMDGVSATSTVRYAMDSILHGQPLGKNVEAARGSEAVVNYVANNPRAVGFIGATWVGDPTDPVDTSFITRVKVAAVRCTTCGGPTYVKPYQANIALHRYPLVRSLYYILKENFSGVGNNFVNFLQYERGQLIFRKAYLVPAGMSFQLRDAQISQ